MKFRQAHDRGPSVLFDHDADPGQHHDLADDPAYAEVLAELDMRLTEFFEHHADPRYDLWNGGRAKGSVLRPHEYQKMYGPDWAPVHGTEPTFTE